MLYYFRQEEDEKKKNQIPHPFPLFSELPLFIFIFVPRHAGITEIPSAPFAFVRWATSGKTRGSSPGQPVSKRLRKQLTAYQLTGCAQLTWPKGPKNH